MHRDVAALFYVRDILLPEFSGAWIGAKALRSTAIQSAGTVAEHNNNSFGPTQPAGVLN